MANTTDNSPDWDWIAMPLTDICAHSVRHKNVKFAIKDGRVLPSQPIIFEPGTPLLEVILILKEHNILRISGSLLNEAKRWREVRSRGVEILSAVTPSRQLGRALAALVEGDL